MTVINVDFKNKKTKQADQPEPEWDALSDPEFQGFMAGVAQCAELMKARGGDWRKVVMIMHDRDAHADPLVKDECGTLIRLTNDNWWSDTDMATAINLSAFQLEDLLEPVEDEDVDPS